MKKLLLASCALGSLIIAEPAAAQGGFEIGPHIGYSNFSVDVEELSESINQFRRYVRAAGFQKCPDRRAQAGRNCIAVDPHIHARNRD